jgi:hypothetical protein
LQQICAADEEDLEDVVEAGGRIHRLALQRR